MPQRQSAPGLRIHDPDEPATRDASPSSLNIDSWQGLARDGGEPVRLSPFATWPVFDQEMQEAVTSVLRSGSVNYWTGQQCREFEREFATFVGTKHAVAVSNGTVAIELALKAAGIEPGTEVIVPPRTFVGTATAVAVHGATPIFADVDPVSGNITADSIADVLSEKTAAIIVVHAAGWPCEMDAIMQLAREHNLVVIEDCAQAHGATYRGQACGSIGHIGTFSFCQDKIMSTGGEGGMLTTNDDALWEAAWSYKDHGKNWDAVYNRQHKTIFKYLHESLGTNWRMTEMQGAIGRIAVQHLPAWIKQRRQNAKTLDGLLEQIPGIDVLKPDADSKHSYYKYYANVSQECLSETWTRDEIVRCLHAEGIPCGSGLCSEIYVEQGLNDAGFAPAERLPNARSIGDRSLMFLVHPTLNASDMQDIATALARVMRHVTAESVPLLRAA